MSHADSEWLGQRMSSELYYLLASIALLVTGVVWAVRQEGRINYLERIVDAQSEELKALRTLIDHTDNKIATVESKIVHELSKGREEMASIREMVARIEGFLKAKE